MPPGVYPSNHRKGPLSSNWKGGKNITNNGYIEIKIESHPRRSFRGYVFEHVLIAERALGHYLPEGAVIHHADEDKQHNENGNLVICQDEAYHQLLHRRARALRESGHAYYRWCWICKRWDDPGNMGIWKRGYQNDRIEHRECNNQHQKSLRKRRNEGKS